jgi:hypothetical protein
MRPDQLKSYGAARRDILPGVEHRQHWYLNNRAGHSHQPTRLHERHMGRFKSPGHAQRFLSAYSPVASHFRAEGAKLEVFQCALGYHINCVRCGGARLELYSRRTSVMKRAIVYLMSWEGS